MTDNGSHEPQWVVAIDFTTRPCFYRVISANHKNNPYTHHDALEFPDGEVVLLTNLVKGQEATVLQLPAQPGTVTAASPLEKVVRVG
jgi:hypothetical protein